MKKFFLSLFLFVLFSLSISAIDQISFNFSSLENLNMNKTSSNIFANLSVTDYSKVLSDDQVKSTIKNIKLANTVLSAIGLTGYASNIVLGAFILNNKFLNQPYHDGFFYSHVPVGLVSGLTFATVLSLDYVNLAIKNKYKIGFNKAHAISIYISTAFAAAEIGLVVANLVTSRLNPEAAKWVGVAHAISMGVTMIGFTVEFATSFIKDDEAK